MFYPPETFQCTDAHAMMHEQAHSKSIKMHTAKGQLNLLLVYLHSFCLDRFS